jgi:hypothetical protein
MSNEMFMQTWNERESHRTGEGATMDDQVSLIQQFINYLRAERHFSPHTSKCYTADLQQFCQHLAAGSEGGNNGGGEPGAGTSAGLNGEELNRRLLVVETETVREFLPQAWGQELRKQPPGGANVATRTLSLCKVPRTDVVYWPTTVAPIRHAQAGSRACQMTGHREIEKLLANPGHDHCSGASDRAMW